MSSLIIGEVIIYSNEVATEEETYKDDLKKKDDKEDLIISKIDTDMVVEGCLEIPFTILEN